MGWSHDRGRRWQQQVQDGGNIDRHGARSPDILAQGPCRRIEGMMNYGLPYKGSKNTIAEQLVKALPRGNKLLDACCGGGAVLMAAAMSLRWNSVVADPDFLVPDYAFPQGLQVPRRTSQGNRPVSF